VVSSQVRSPVRRTPPERKLPIRLVLPTPTQSAESNFHGLHGRGRTRCRRGPGVRKQPARSVFPAWMPPGSVPGEWPKSAQPRSDAWVQVQLHCSYLQGWPPGGYRWPPGGYRYLGGGGALVGAGQAPPHLALLVTPPRQVWAVSAPGSRYLAIDLAPFSWISDVTRSVTFKIREAGVLMDAVRDLKLEAQRT
jgi:hypothetical protein